MKNLIYIFISLIAFGNFVQAQETEEYISPLPDNMIFVGYEVSIPTSTEYLSETSWAGFRMEYRHMVTRDVSVGLAASFNTFDEYFSKQTYYKQDGTGAVTSDMIRQVYITPLTATVHYYFRGNKITPYVGIGLGAQYSEQNAYFNIYGVSTNNWGFVTRPEAGAMAKFNSNLSGFLSVAYNYSTNKNDNFNITNLSHIPISIGLVFNP